MHNARKDTRARAKVDKCPKGAERHLAAMEPQPAEKPEMNIGKTAGKRSITNLLRHSERSEKSIERYLFDRVKAMGGECLKYSNPNMAGYPDRIAVMPGGVTVWVELKSRGAHPRALQEVRIARLRDLGHRVHVIDSREGVDAMLGEL